MFIAVSIYASIQFAGEQGNKELEQINSRISTIEYNIRHDELPVEKVIALNEELKKLKLDKEHKEASQEALGKLKTSLGKKAEKVYQAEGAKPAIEVLTSKSALANQESRLKDISKEKLALAKLYVEIYEFDKAEENYRKATEIFFDYENAYTYGMFLSKQNNFNKAIEIYEKLLNIKLLISEKATVFKELANLYNKIDRFKESEELYSKALKIYYSLAKKDPDIYNPKIMHTLRALANLFFDLNRFTKVEDLYSESIKINRALVKKSPNEYNPDLASTLSNLAVLYSDTNRIQESELLYLDSLKIYRASVKKNLDAYSPDLARTLGGLANLYFNTNRFKKAEDSYSESIKIYRSLVKKNPDVYSPDLARTLQKLSYSL